MSVNVLRPFSVDVDNFINAKKSFLIRSHNEFEVQQRLIDLLDHELEEMRSTSSPKLVDKHCFAEEMVDKTKFGR